MIVLHRKVGMYVPASRQAITEVLAHELATEQGGASIIRGAGGFVNSAGAMVREVVDFVWCQYGDSDNAVPLARIVGKAAAALFKAGEESVGVELDGTLILLFGNEYLLDSDQEALADGIADDLLTQVWR